MVKNYLVTALRSLLKTRAVTAINIAGLSIGLTCAFLVLLFVQSELSVDRFHRKIDRLYSVTISGESKDISKSPEYRSDIDYRLAPVLLNDYPEITNVVRLMPQLAMVSRKNLHIREYRFWFADANVFSVLTLPLRRGDPETALQSPCSVVITPEIARKYFGNQDPIGQTFKAVFHWFPISYTFTVTGILDPLPEASSMRMDFLAHVPFERVRQDSRIVSGEGGTTVYVMTLVELASPSAFEPLQAKLQELEIRDDYKDLNLSDMKCRIEPLKDAYSNAKATFFEADSAPFLDTQVFRKSHGQLLVTIAVMGTVILLVSCVNIINFETARATLRAKEIGIRKVMGAYRHQLIVQFIAETVLISYVALLIALVATELLLPWFNALTQRQLDIDYARDAGYLLGLVGVATLTGILSGAYPAFALSAFKPVTALKSQRLRSSAFLRKALMTVQIGVCVMVFLFALVVRDEMEAMRSITLGFNPKNLIFFQITDPNLVKRYKPMKSELERMKGVVSVTSSSFVPWEHGAMLYFSFVNQDVAVRTPTLVADTSFIKTYEIPITDGRGFRTEFINNTGRIIVNQTARRLLQSAGIDPLSRSLGTATSWYWRHRLNGIMQDFYCYYPTKHIQPMAIMPSKYLRMGREFITVRMAEGKQAETIDGIRKAVNRFFPKAPFDYRYVAKEMEKLHNRRMGYRWSAMLLTSVASLVAAIIGLLGFSAYEAERCTKEIGIRKALGATSGQIALRFILRFSRLSLLANIISWPICHFVLHWILKAIDYPHPVQIEFTDYLWAGLLTLSITVVTVWLQTYRAARVDPVRALRYE